MRRRRASASPLGPPGRLLSGNLQDYEQDRLGFLIAARNTYGPVVRFDKHTTIVNDISMANEVLLDRDASFAIRHNFLQQTIPDAELDGWQAARKLVNPRMRRTLTNAHMRTVAAVAGEHLAGLSDLHGDKPFDAMTAMENIASHSIARFYFGKDSAGIPEAVGALLNALSVLIGNPFALPSSIRTPARRRVEHELACLRRILDPLIANRAGLNRPGTDFVSSLFRGQTPTDRPPVERVKSLGVV